MNEPEAKITQQDYARQMHRWRMAFFGLIILLAGIVIGASSIMLLGRGRLPLPPPPEIAAERLTIRQQRYLDLSPEQVQKIEPIIQKYMQRLRQSRIAARQQINEQLRLMNLEVSSILNDRQKNLWQQHLQQLQRQLQPGPQKEQRGPLRRRFGQQGPLPPEQELFEPAPANQYPLPPGPNER